MATVIKTIVAKLHVVEHDGVEYHVQVKPEGGYIVWTQQKGWKLIKDGSCTDAITRSACVKAVEAL